MKVAYDTVTGRYVDNEDSHKQGYYVGNLRGAREEDLVVLDVPREDEPWTKKLVDGRLVPDEEKLSAAAAAKDHELAEAQRLKDLRTSLKSKLMTGQNLTADEADLLMGE
jgi:hypothetical protein